MWFHSLEAGTPYAKQVPKVGQYAQGQQDEQDED